MSPPTSLAAAPSNRCEQIAQAIAKDRIATSRESARPHVSDEEFDWIEKRVEELVELSERGTENGL